MFAMTAAAAAAATSSLCICVDSGSDGSNVVGRGGGKLGTSMHCKERVGSDETVENE